MLNPSCKPKDWAIKRQSRQPRDWEGSKISVDELIGKSCKRGVYTRFLDALKTWRSK